MILDDNDPTGLGLFSRCARNQACKATKSRPHTAGSKKTSPSLKVEETKRKNSHGGNWFAKHESREQRERKYKKECTPAVGQYNTLIKEKPKMVWDLIKNYQKKNKDMKKLEEIKDKIKLKEETVRLQKSQEKQQKKDKQNTSQNQPEPSKGNRFTEVAEDKLMEEEKSSRNMQSKNRYKTTMSHKSTCMVDMSRTSGRKSESINKKGRYGLTLDEESMNFFDTVELNKSVQKIKPRTTKNFYFKKMLGRKDYEKPIGTANIYDCKMGLIKPNRTAQLNFGIVQGREQVSPRRKQEGFVSGYNYYDYNEYVWKGTSAVFPNTKRHLISFDKQR